MRMSAVATVFLILVPAGAVSAGDALVVGVPFEDIGDIYDAGAVNVLYSNAAGLTSDGNQFWHQDSSGIAGMAEDSDRFGNSLASGDFDGDGLSDLAVGVPYEIVDGADSAGMVNVLYAGGSGVLGAAGNQRWHKSWDGLGGTPETFDLFAKALAAGDFNGDGFDDLAIGIPGEEVNVANAGVVCVLYGSAAGLASAGQQWWNQNSTDVPGVAEAGDRLGESLATGDFDGDGFDDLAIGVPDEEVSGQNFAGAVNVLYGSSSGLSGSGSDLWTDPWVVFDGAGFGSALAAGDLDGDGRDELAIGAPYMAFGGVDGAGTVTLLRGTAGGLSSSGYQGIAQGASIPGGYVADEWERDDRFGWALEIGDFDGDGYDDLAVGVPREDLDAIPDAGVVHILFGSVTGITAAGNQLWHQNLDAVWGIADEYDEFGSSLAAGHFNSDRFCDLAVGVPFESYDAPNSPGVVNVFHGSSVGFASGNRMWSQGMPGMEGAFEDNDFFGDVLTVMPSNVLFHDGFESGTTGGWSFTVP